MRLKEDFRILVRGSGFWGTGEPSRTRSRGFLLFFAIFHLWSV